MKTVKSAGEVVAEGMELLQKLSFSLDSDDTFRT